MFLKAYPTELRSFVLKVLLYAFSWGTIFFQPIYMLYLADLGFKPLIATALLSIWYLSGFLFELPSSVLADRLSRKQIIIIGELSSAIGFALFWLFPSFWGVAAGFLIWGLRGALVSGTIEAYLYDELKHYNKTEFFVKLQGHRATVGWIGLFVAALGVWFYQTYGVGFVVLMSVFSRVLASIIVSTFTENGFVTQVKDKQTKTLWHHLLAAKEVMRQDYWLVVIMLLAACMTNIALIRNLATAMGAELEMTAWQGTLGMMLISAAFVLGSIVGPYIKFEKLRYFLWFALLPCLLVILSSVVNRAILFFILLAVAFFVYQIWAVHSMAQRQERVPSHLRATVISVGGMFDRLISVASLNILGALANKTSYHFAAQSLVWPALAVLGAVGIYGVWVRLCGVRKPSP